MSIGVPDLSAEDEIIAITLAGISGIVGERSQDLEAQSTYPPVYRGLIEVGQRMGQRVEWPPVIAEFDFYALAVEREVNFDPALRGFVVITVIDRIGEQLLENDQEPSALAGGQSVVVGKPFDKAD